MTDTSKPSIHVVAGVIRRRDRRILICLRPRHLDQGGLWEFPGGKLEAGESRFGALVRELREELDIEIKRGAPLLRLKHDYPDKTVDLDVWEVSAWEGREKALEGQQIRWVSPEDLHCYDFPAANASIINAANLPRVVLLTWCPLRAVDQSVEKLAACLRAGIRTVVLCPDEGGRDVEPAAATRAADVCEKYGAKLLLSSSSAHTVSCLGAAGQHLTSSSLRQVPERPLGTGYIVSAACEDARDVAHAERIGADFILVGAAFASSVDRGFAPLDWRKLTQLVTHTKTPAYACGALQPAHLERAIASGCQGIALQEGPWSDDPGQAMTALDRALLAADVDR